MVATIVYLSILLAKCIAVVAVTMTFVSYSVVAERRFSAWIQDRIGPNRVGIPLTNIKLLGLGQPIADAVKLMLKEEFTPAHVNKFYFTLAPMLAVIPPLITISVIPFGSTLDLRPLLAPISSLFPNGISMEIVNLFYFKAVIADINMGLLFIFAIVSLSVYGIVLAGWSSNSKYSFLGGIRSSAQIISYEIAMGLSVIPVFLVVGNLNLGTIVEYQAQHGWLALPFWPLTKESLLLGIPLLFAFFIFMISSFAETNRLPFDMPECESELVGGYHTEYSSMKFGLFFLGEYAAMIVASCVMVTVFLGGWSLPFPMFNGVEAPWWFGIVHIGVFLAKIFFFMFLFIWVRWTLPRFRYDQLMNLGWKFFIPAAFVNVFVTAGILAYLS
jgi:NADH-quinone oxidoreductase subunit H